MRTSQTDGGITEVLVGTEKAVDRGVKFMANTKKRMDLCFDHRAPSIVVEVHAYSDGYKNIRMRGGKIRVITEMTSNNLRYCKDLLNLVDELKHMKGIVGGIAVNEFEFMATTLKPSPSRR
jgi:two-component system, OmpR family, sensor histidine kinase VicK